jgi:integrase
MPRKTNCEINGIKYNKKYLTIGHKADGTPIIKQFYGKSEAEATQRRDEYKAAMKGGLVDGFEKRTLGAAYYEWYRGVNEPNLAESSKGRYKKDNERILSGSLAPMILTDIRAIHIQNFCTDLLDAGVSVGCVQNVQKRLKPFFNYCVATDLVIKNPMKGVKMPVSREIKEDIALLDEAELQKIITDAVQSMGKQTRRRGSFIFMFLALTGLREGEALGLRHSDIDFDAGVVHINKTMAYLTVDEKYQAVVGDVKTEKSRRDVPLLPELKPLLQKHIISEKEKFLRLGIPFDGEILFSSETGTYVQAKNLRISFERLQDRLGLKKATVHSLRHLFCTMLAKNNVPLKTAQVLMGHSDIKITAEIYAHVQSEDKQRAIATLSSIFAAAV